MFLGDVEFSNVEPAGERFYASEVTGRWGLRESSDLGFVRLHRPILVQRDKAKQ